VEQQLEYLESPRAEMRRSAQQTLMYLLQGELEASNQRHDLTLGCFGETTSPEMQLHWVIENAKTVRAVDGVGTLVIALKDASKRYHMTW